MEELYEKIANLKEVLNEQTEVKEIRRLNKKIKEDKELLDLLERYKIDKSLLPKIESNKLFQEYKEKETDLNILILKINERLKEITKKDRCQG